MAFQVTPSVDDIQPRTFPTDPFNVSAVLLRPEQTVALLNTLPATVGGVTETVMVSLRSAQLFFSLTVIVPGFMPGVTLTIFELAPELIVHPAGTVQL